MENKTRKDMVIVWEIYSGTPESGDLIARAVGDKPQYVDPEYTLARFEYTHAQWSVMNDDCPECSKPLSDEGVCYECSYVPPMFDEEMEND